MSDTDQRRNLIAASLKVLNEEHKETLQALAKSEKKDLEFQLAMAEDVWLKVKGYPIPDSYSIKDRLEIFERYYHRAVSQSQGE
jgi:glucose-6-phosphate isomerase